MGARGLVIYDDVRLGEVRGELLRGGCWGAGGCEVGGRGGGGSGLARLGEAGFDAVILDVMLPDLDGFEVCRRIRARSQVAVLMLTARGDDLDRIVGLELGADD